MIRASKGVQVLIAKDIMELSIVRAASRISSIETLDFPDVSMVSSSNTISIARLHV